MQISPCIIHRLSVHCCGVHFCNQINHNKFLFFQMITLRLLFVNTQNEMHLRVTELSAKIAFYAACALGAFRFLISAVITIHAPVSAADSSTVIKNAVGP